LTGEMLLHSSREKKEKDVVKKRRNRKILEQEALIKCRCKQRLEGLPEEESPLRRPRRKRMMTTMMVMMMPSHGMTPRLRLPISLMCGSCRSPSAGG
jgi:hypothetical protein